MAMESRASSSCAQGLLGGDGGLTPNPDASLSHQRPNADGSLGGKRRDLVAVTLIPLPPRNCFTLCSSSPKAFDATPES